MWKDFTDFIKRGNVVDLAVGIVIGSAFTAVSKSLVDDVIMPPIGLLLGNVDFGNLFVVLQAGKTAGPYATLEAARSAGAVAIAYGQFVNVVLNFLIVAAAMFFVVQAYQRLQQKKEEAPVTKRKCPFCISIIDDEAVKCPECTADLPEAAAAE